MTFIRLRLKIANLWPRVSLQRIPILFKALKINEPEVQSNIQVRDEGGVHRAQRAMNLTHTWLFPLLT